jgi:hypothetical protein
LDIESVHEYPSCRPLNDWNTRKICPEKLTFTLLSPKHSSTCLLRYHSFEKKNKGAHLKKKQRGRVISRHSRLFWWIWILCHLALGLRTASMIFERTWKQKLASPAAGHFYLWQIKGQKSFCSPLRIMLLSNLLHCHLYMTYMSTQEFQCIQMCVSSIYRHIYVCK